MDEQHTIEQALGAALTEDELSLVVGGDSDPNDPVGTVTGVVDMDMKATPVLL
jgi:hypothetical protein